MPLLTEAEYLATMRSPMQPVTDQNPPPLDFWPYVDTIPEADFGGYDFSAGRVGNVWRTPDGQFEHVLVSAAETRDVFLVIVIDDRQHTVVGHHLLDLPALYRLREGRPV